MTNQPTNLASNIWKYTVFLITHKRPFMSIFGVYLLTLPGATPKSIGLTLLAGYLAGFFFEIPSGYIADKIGHKQALVFSKISLLISTLLYLFGTSVSYFVVGAVFLNFAISFHSGTGTAFMHETLRGLGREKEYSKVMGRVSSIGFAIPIALIVLIPFLVSISFRVPFAVVALLDILGLVSAIFLVVPERTKEEIKEIGVHNFWAVVRECYRFGFFKYAVFLSLVMGLILSVSGYKDVYQAFLGVPIIYYGIFWATSRVLVSLLLLINDKVKTYLSFHQFLGLKLLFSLAILFGLGLFPIPFVIVPLLIFASAFNWSFKETKNHYLLDIIERSNFKATILSIESLLSSIVAAVFGFILGYIITQGSYPSAFLFLAFSSLALLSVSFGFILFQSYRRHYV